MFDIKQIISKFFRILNEQDYDTELKKDLENTEPTFENFDSGIDSVLDDMTSEELKHTLKQFFKRDTSHGIFLGQTDEVWDKLEEWRRELE